MKTNIPKSFLKLLNYQITDSRFQIKEGIVRSITYSIDLQPILNEIQQVSEDEFNGKVTLKISIKGKAKNKIIHKVEVTIVGYFKGIGITQKEFEKLCRLNGVANLIMLSRSFIASVTSQLNIRPIILPFFNLVAAQKNNLQKK